MKPKTSERTDSKPYESDAVLAVTQEAIRPGGLALTRYAAGCIGLKPGDRILDAGCGMGATVDFLNACANVHAVGLDVSEKLVGKARSRYPASDFLRGDAMFPPLKPGTMDAVFCECALSLLPVQEKALAVMYDVLKPGGHLIISDLYQRGGGLKTAAGTGKTRVCLEGAVDRATMGRWVMQAGFTICLWEDRSDLLKRLAAQLVWAGVSLEQWWGGNGRKSRLPAKAGPGCQAPGYFLMIARKKEKADG